MTDYQKLVSKVINAYQAGNAADRFDLNSKDHLSKKAWKRLLKSQHKYYKKLVKFIVAHPKCYKAKD